MKKCLSALALFGLIACAPAIASQGSGCLPTTGTVSGLSMTQYINSAIAAIISGNSGASAPATDCTTVAVKGQVWLDTSLTPNVMKQYDGTSWVVLGAIDATNHLWAPPIGGGTASVTAASTTDICAAPASLQAISGTTSITSFGSACVVGVTKKLRFGAATPITYNATSMILPGQRDFVAAAGDMADATYLGSGNWQISSITKIDGSSVTNPAVALGTVMYGDFGDIPPKTLVGSGQAISRSSYPDYLAAVTRSQSGTLTSGNNTITSIASGRTRGLGAGMPIEGTGIQAGTTVTSVTSTTIVMSKTATANGAQNFTVFLTGYGSGGDSTTVGVKDCVGKTLAGLDPSGANLSGATAINAGIGNQTKTLGTVNLPPYTPSGSVSTTVNGNGAITAGGSNTTNVPGTAPFWVAGGSASPTAVSTFTGTAQGGTSTPFSLVQPTSVAECVVVVLP